MDTPTTPNPAELDTLTDTVGSRIEFTASGNKYSGVLDRAFQYGADNDDSTRICVRLLDVKPLPSLADQRIAWLDENLGAKSVQKRPIQAIKNLRAHFHPTPTLHEAKDAVDAYRAHSSPSTGRLTAPTS